MFRQKKDDACLFPALFFFPTFLLTINMASVDLAQPNGFDLSLPTDEPMALSREELISQATQRLRSKLLQDGLATIKDHLASMQQTMDELRLEIDTTASILTKFDPPDDRQLTALERRLQSHEQQFKQALHQAQQQPLPSTPSLPANAISTSTSFSSTLSRMSSIFSRSPTHDVNKKRHHSPSPTPPLTLPDHPHDDDDLNTTITSDNDNDATASVQAARDRRRRRRQRVQQLRREYQQRLRMYDPLWNSDDWQSAKSPSSSSSLLLAIQPPIHPPPSTLSSCSSSSPASSARTTERAAPHQPRAPLSRPARSQGSDASAQPDPMVAIQAPSQPHVRSWVLDQQQCQHQWAPDTSTFHHVMQCLNSAQSEVNNHDLHDLLLPAGRTLSRRSLHSHHEHPVFPRPLRRCPAHTSPWPATPTTSSFRSGPSSSTFPSQFYQLPFLVLLMKQGVEKVLQLVFFVVSKSLSWIKFLSVISISLLISLGRGPDQMLLSLNEWVENDDELYYS
ncbi:hypothetical protein DM01DRAFT_1405558 [Hesseltinella vesiculosa]|uniref:Uncharacterized protein n=1 Tax=Hesseltinella vesiculosa TaxID=101127 RepID=A0A1X2GQD0_9FUNG|nr:hypothetical protein DM01DRAFT_1405558 [Hesseltinella vesiculosa]